VVLVACELNTADACGLIVVFDGSVATCEEGFEVGEEQWAVGYIPAVVNVEVECELVGWVGWASLDVCFGIGSCG
jgi:hypothetical protein